MDKKLRNSLLKSAGFLIIVIILFAALSRTLLSGGQTLSEYAEQNPDLAYGNASEEDIGLPADTATLDTSADLSAVDTNTAVTGDDNTDANAMDDAGEEAANPDRITYQHDFYYEPLSEEYKERITGISYPAEDAAEISYEELRYVHVLHYDFNGDSAEGELICNNAIAQDLVEIFYELYLAEYRIEKIALIEEYAGDDNASMAANNTSCFNYRTVDGTDKLSQHAYGLAIDINPFYNPYVRYTNDGGLIVSPEGSEDYADRTSNFPYKIDTSDLCYRLFIEHGFTWGGNWNSSKDYQHFQKTLN